MPSVDRQTTGSQRTGRRSAWIVLAAVVGILSATSGLKAVDETPAEPGIETAVAAIATSDEGQAAAVQEETANVLPPRPPRAFNVELLESVDIDWATKASAAFETVYNSNLATSERLAAVANLREIVSGMPQPNAEAASLRSQMLRRLSVVEGALRGAGAPLTEAPQSALGQVVDEASAVESWLSGINNGDAWKEYLELSRLQQLPRDGNVEGDVRETLSRVQTNLALRDRFEDAQAKFLQKPQIDRLSAAINAALEQGEIVAAGDDAVQTALLKLTTAVDDYEDSAQLNDAGAIRAAYSALRRLSPEAAASVRGPMMQHYLNHNLHILVSGQMVRQIVNDHRNENGTIADCILGAWVTGVSSTDANVAISLVPSATQAQFRLTLNGTTNTNTQARKQPATIYGRGTHYFTAHKDISFDGRGFSVTPASIGVDTNNFSYAARTDYDNIPLLGLLIRGPARSIALKEARKKKTESEAIAAQKLASQVLPEFNQEVDSRFYDADSELRNDLMPRLERRGIAPEDFSLRTSSTHIAYSSRTLTPGRLGGATQPPQIIPSRGITVQLHESLANTFVDCFDLAGRTIPEEDLEKEIEAILSELLDKEINLKKDEDTATSEPAPESAESDEEDDGADAPTTFVFNEVDPIRFRFDNNTATLVLRAAVKQEGKKDIPEQTVEIPMALSVTGGKVVISAGEAKVSAKEAASRIEQIGRAAQIRRIIRARVQDEELDPTVNLPVEGKADLLLTVQSIEAKDGWLTLLLE